MRLGKKGGSVAALDRLPEQRKAEYIPPAEDIDRVMLQRYYFTFARRDEIFN